MVRATTYDKVSWHYPEGKNCPSFEAAKVHFDVIMNWLESHRLLSAEGLEAMEIGIDSDFSLTANMLTEKGNQVLAKCYGEWSSTVRYHTRPSVKLLEDCLLRV